MGQSIQRVDTARAYALASGNAMIAAAYSNDLLLGLSAEEGAPNPAQLARDAIGRDALATDAITVLAVLAQSEDDTERARQLFGYSNLLSRRELPTRLWAIEEAVSRGDIDGALANYDIAIRTSRSARSQLLGGLVRGLSEPLVRQRILAFLRREPSWGRQFLAEASASDRNPRDVYEFFLRAERAGIPIESEMQANLVDALLRAQDPDLAWRAYSELRPDARRQFSRDPDWTSALDVRTGFDWVTNNSDGISAAILPADEGGVLDFAVPPGRGGLLAYQRQLLPMGEYQLEGMVERLDVPEDALPYWVLRCDDGRELGRVDVPTTSGQAVGKFAGRFTVPERCPIQTLELIARSSDSITGPVGQIARAQLNPVTISRVEETP